MNKMAVSAAIPESDLSIITSAIACLPSTAAAVQEIKPILASAVVDPYDVLAQPLSTFSQAIDIVMESCKTVEKDSPKPERPLKMPTTKSDSQWSCPHFMTYNPSILTPNKNTLS